MGRRLFSELIRGRSTWKWVILVTSALGLTLIEMVSAAYILTLLSVFTGGGLELDLFGLVDVAPLLGDSPGTALAVIGIVLFPFRSLLLLGERYLQARVVEGETLYLSTTLIDGYLEMPYAWHLTRHSSVSLRNAFFSVQEAIGKYMTSAVRVMSESALMIGVLAIVVLAAPLIGLVVPLVVGLLVGLTLRAIRQRLRLMGRTTQEAMNDSLKTATEAIEMIRDVQLSRSQPYFVRTFRRQRSRYARAAALRSPLSEVPRQLVETIAFVGLIGWAFFGGFLEDGGDVGAVVPLAGLVAYAVIRVMPSINRISNSITVMRFADAAVSDVLDDLHIVQPVLDARDSAGPGVQRLGFDRAISLHSVSFRYPAADADALSDIDLVLEVGSRTGIVGTTGAGKSTLVDVVAGLLTPTSGSIEVDGKPRAGREREWFDLVGYVSQSVRLIDDTLAANVALGQQGGIDQVRLKRVLSIAQLDEVVGELERGIDTMLGERGSRLSGGQRQRVAVARALYRLPRLLIFDEATSALDPETERHLIDAITASGIVKTIVMVTHRLESVRGCDEVVLLEHGRIAMSGAYDDVIGSPTSTPVTGTSETGAE